MHIKKDYNMLKNKVLIDSDEKVIDDLALNEMIPKELYGELINTNSNIDKTLINNKIPLCFFYTRLALEGKIKYNSKEYLNNIEKIDK